MSYHNVHESSGMRLRALRQCLAGRPIAVLHEGQDGVYDFAENLPPGWPSQNPIGADDASLLPPDLAETLAETKAEVLSSSEPRTVEIEVIGQDRPRLFQVQVSPDYEETGAPAGLFTVLTDISERRDRDLAIASLMRELSHRSKNLLAIAQSLAMQTARHSDGTAEFLRKFRGRLQALASTQDLVTESDWRGTQFRALVEAQLSKIVDGRRDAISVSGDNPLLGPNAALHIGLAIHELAANAAVHGGLSDNENGQVQIAATLGGGLAGGKTLTIDWRESVPAGRIANQPRFGTLVLERIVPLSVGGSAAYEVGDERVVYKLTVPSAQFES